MEEKRPKALEEKMNPEGNGKLQKYIAHACLKRKINL
jgi:hypothetical protein